MDIQSSNKRGHDYRYAINSSKIKKELGWEPSVTVEEGLRTYIYADPFFRRSYKAAEKANKGKSPKSFDDFLDSDFNLFSIFE